MDDHRVSEKGGKMVSGAIEAERWWKYGWPMVKYSFLISVFAAGTAYYLGYSSGKKDCLQECTQHCVNYIEDNLLGDHQENIKPFNLSSDSKLEKKLMLYSTKNAQK